MVTLPQPSLELAEQVARTAGGLGIDTAVIGAVAMAGHNYVRGTDDVDLGSAVDPTRDLVRLARELEAQGLHTELRQPDSEDPLGGLLRVWAYIDDEGEPVQPVEVVNYTNPHAPRRTPGLGAIQNAIEIEGSSLRYVRLEWLIALKLYAGSRSDERDVVELLARNPNADLDEIRAVAKRFGYEGILEELIVEARQT